MTTLHKDCCSGSLHTKTVPTGRVIEIAGFPAYEAVPTSGNDYDKKKVLIIATDIFGWELPNNRLIADNYAAKGIRTIVPNIFNGSLPTDLFDVMNDDGLSTTTAERKVEIQAYKSKHFQAFMAANNLPQGEEYMKKIIKSLREREGVERIGMQGYCWGGGICVHLSQEEGIIQATLPTHPSRVTIEDIPKIVVPSCFMLAEEDHGISVEMAHKIEAILKEKEGSSKIPYHFKLFMGVKHGWAVRGDENNKDVEAKRQECFDMGLAFLHAHL